MEVPFFETFFEGHILIKNNTFLLKLLPNSGSQLSIIGARKLANVEKTEHAFRLRRRVQTAYGPQPWSDQSEPKNEVKQERASSAYAFQEKTKNVSNYVSKMCPKR